MYLSFIEPSARGIFGEILPEETIFSKGLCPEENIITENPKNLKNPPS
jgi:hypothetical protein